MFSRLLDKALVKLEIKDSAIQTSAKAEESVYPTLSFPSLLGGTLSLCHRCLTLMSHFITRFGDGTNQRPLSITHSAAMRDVSHAVQMTGTVARMNTSECVICIKTFILFKAMQAHISFEDSWQSSPSTDWSVTWVADLPSYESNHQDRLHVKFSVRHRRGYTWGLGGFMLYPETSASLVDYERKQSVNDMPMIGPLDDYGSTSVHHSYVDFSSTMSPGTLPLVSSWMKECTTSHSKCHRIFGSDDLSQPAPWFPDRLIQVRRKASGALTARLVLKSNSVNFSNPNAEQLKYLSFSHCWGPPPNPSAPLGGRVGSVLTSKTLSTWTDFLPVNNLPLAFRHAITICAWLNFEYIWIDSLCILQDSLEDWQTQSAVMGDVYKFAFLNIAALSSLSDFDGFIFPRDTRVAFGFRCPFANLLGANVRSPNQEGKQCLLLQGKARLLWDYSADIQGSTDSNTPLFTRAWVYQERSLARRTLAFANTTVYWCCDELSLSEMPGWGGFSPEGLRKTLHGVTETINTTSPIEGTEQRAQSLFKAFDDRWHDTVLNYTSCKLTKHTDKLVAVSSIARELANTRIMQNHRYLAGFWDMNLVAQLGWITIVGEKTPPRRRFGDEGYVAPSWSWASVDAPVQPRRFFGINTFTTLSHSLADVLDADIELATDYEFGPVKAGWIRLRGILNRVGKMELVDRFSKSLSLTDEATGEKLWFSSDTIEGFDIVRRGRAQSLVWMPLSMSFDNSISCSCLVLLEVDGVQYSGPKGFIKKDEKVYRRMGTGNFGKSIKMLKPTDLVLSLGTYSDFQQDTAQGAEIARGFRIKQDGKQEFVLI